MQHELLTPLTKEQLIKCRTKIAAGYPDADKKLILTPGEWQEIASNGFVLPIGAWTVDKHPKRLKSSEKAHFDPIYTAENPMPPKAIERWKALGLRYDASTGLPIHPRAEQLLTTPNLGMFTQVGSFYRPGPNEIANGGLRRKRGDEAEYACVAVEREDGLVWSLGGGFFDPGQDKDLFDATSRELLEEIGISIKQLGGLAVKQYNDGPQYAWAATANAWMQESYLFMQSHANPALEGFETLEPNDRKEVVATDWLTPLAMRNLGGQFMETHLSMVDRHENTLMMQGM